MASPYPGNDKVGTVDMPDSMLAGIESKKPGARRTLATAARTSPLRVVAGGLLCAAAVFAVNSLRGSASSLPLPAHWKGDLGQGAGAGATPSQEINGSEDRFDWSKITPTEDFEFHPCFGDYQCARLSVPLNWNLTSVSSDERLALAVIKYPAKVPVTDSRYAGPILLNPGGPGGSGVSLVLKIGKQFQVLADPHDDPGAPIDDSNGDRYYDIVSFDPRGVGATTPRMACFPDMAAYGNWKSSAPSGFLLEASEYVFHESWARSFAFGDACARQRGGGDQPNIIHYMNTPQVVEDMMAIVDRHAQWRERTANKMLRHPSHRGLSKDEVYAIQERTAFQPGEDKLNYYGVSYGTLLGQTAATMHPGRVGRMVLDAVVDAADYYALGWTTNLQDTDRILVRWSDYCQQSGSKDKCPFYLETAPSGYLPAVIAHLTNSFMESPKPLPPSDKFGSWVFGYHNIMDYLMRSLYQPFAKAEDILNVLRWDSGEAVEKAEAWKAHGIPGQPSRRCLEAGPWSEPCITEQGDDFSVTGILCSEGPDISTVTKDEFRDYMHQLQGQSDVMGTYWASIRLSCIGWKGRPAWEFKGRSLLPQVLLKDHLLRNRLLMASFRTSTRFLCDSSLLIYAFMDLDSIGATTANPILFIGASYDPVTPIRNARAASKLFPGSVVLHHNSEGHGFYRSPSIDTGKAFRAFFQHGELPDPDAKPAEPEYRPWIGCVNRRTNCENRTEEDEKLWRALEVMARS
ncbi:hypothetical protein Micbo1qcDRAFT_204813 [Microdochium bolleyi]|uniref:Peptidase S33 tripeptidyl aminopeptidase-like C-terminal domain-containing protein n=1 Tax=Microdochium bolleyi TaxID=196109 RepID=A0A136J352_9PEZI|nr:hypothetical protein Micbo1qcDRAFT_204813 [Microdochium bolleyi]